MNWTQAEEQGIRDARAAGMTWQQTGLSIHRGKQEVRDHAQIGMGMSAWIQGKAPQHGTFTQAEEQGIRDARAAGKSWQQTGLSIHRGVADVRDYAQSVMELPAWIPGKEPQPKRTSDDRQPLPAGHQDSWGAITAGTVLDGATFRFDVRACAT